MIGHLYKVKEGQDQDLGLDLRVSAKSQDTSKQVAKGHHKTPNEKCQQPSWSEIKSNTTLHKTMVYTAILAVSECMTGMIMLSLYTQRIVATFDLSKIATQMVTIGAALVRLAFALLASFFIPKFGRRQITVVSYSIVFVANLMMFIAVFLIESQF